MKTTTTASTSILTSGMTRTPMGLETTQILTMMVMVSTTLSKSHATQIHYPGTLLLLIQIQTTSVTQKTKTTTMTESQTLMINSPSMRMSGQTQMAMDWVTMRITTTMATGPLTCLTHSH